MSITTPQQALAALLNDYSPKRLLVIGNSEIPALLAFQEANQNCVIEKQSAAPLAAHLASQRFDVAILADCLEHLPKNTAFELIAGIRNLNASRIAVLVDLNACEWQNTDFYALALQKSGDFTRDKCTLTLYTYDLAEYKQVPDWLNAKFWANPENFDKYWW